MSYMLGLHDEIRVRHQARAGRIRPCPTHAPLEGMHVRVKRGPLHASPGVWGANVHALDETHVKVRGVP
jgi:hypothetical protein